jgi:hypothetical protein
MLDPLHGPLGFHLDRADRSLGFFRIKREDGAEVLQGLNRSDIGLAAQGSRPPAVDLADAGSSSNAPRNLEVLAKARKSLFRR